MVCLFRLVFFEVRLPQGLRQIFLRLESLVWQPVPAFLQRFVQDEYWSVSSGSRISSQKWHYSLTFKTRFQNPTEH